MKALLRKAKACNFMGKFDVVIDILEHINPKEMS
jgi:hypothetical protein